jgi:formamidopyrimidine-DNA glycosylase
MPELPEVETVVAGIEPIICGLSIHTVSVFHQQLRNPIQQDLASIIQDKVIQSVHRRAKYIIINVDVDLIIHLGMSGKLIITSANYTRVKHDHIVFHLSNGQLMVYNDPRRFGMVFWHTCAADYLSHYGVEPLSDMFTAEYLYKYSRAKRTPIKALIMNQSCVVGVGNIYACEALFSANISPLSIASSLTHQQCVTLVICIKTTLKLAIEQGGTTLKDYRTADNALGYFQQSLYVYGRAGEPCIICKTSITMIKLVGRSTFYCESCQ